MSREETILNVWNYHYRRTLIFEEFIKWFTPRIKEVRIGVIAVFTFAALLFIISEILSNKGIDTNWLNSISMWIFISWGIIILLFTVILGFDNFLTVRSMSKIMGVLDKKGIEYHTLQQMKDEAKQLGFTIR